MAQTVLTINSGSSSLKAELYACDSDGQQRQSSVEIQAVGGVGGISFGEAFRRVLDRLPSTTLDAIGHRVVHGGSRFTAPAGIDETVITYLTELIPIDPTHLPQAIELMKAAALAAPGVQQVACFDTAFHRTMPRLAQLEPLPRALFDQGVQRYGFHGLSYEYVLGELARVDASAAAGRVIIAHLGNGASMVAIRNGKSVDTTMGFTPAGGLMMGTRSGDIDPGVLLHLQRVQGLSVDTADDLVNRKSGLLGVSAQTSDMRDLLKVSAQDERAREAVDLFCYTARKFIGSLAAVLGGLDTLVFTGGIGERAAPIRQAICESLGFLGITLNREANIRNDPIISAAGRRATVRVIPTDEDAVIARHTFDTLWP